MDVESDFVVVVEIDCLENQLKLIGLLVGELDRITVLIVTEEGCDIFLTKYIVELSSIVDIRPQGGVAHHNAVTVEVALSTMHIPIRWIYTVGREIKLKYTFRSAVVGHTELRDEIPIMLMVIVVVFPSD